MRQYKIIEWNINQATNKDGRNFSIYDKELKKDIWSIKFGCGIPDHAILSGEFILEKKGGQSQ